MEAVGGHHLWWIMTIANERKGQIPTRQLHRSILFDWCGWARQSAKLPFKWAYWRWSNDLHRAICSLREHRWPAEFMGIIWHNGSVSPGSHIHFGSERTQNAYIYSSHSKANTFRRYVRMWNFFSPDSFRSLFFAVHFCSSYWRLCVCVSVCYSVARVDENSKWSLKWIHANTVLNTKREIFIFLPVAFCPTAPFLSSKKQQQKQRTRSMWYTVLQLDLPSWEKKRNKRNDPTLRGRYHTHTLRHRRAVL